MSGQRQLGDIAFALDIKRYPKLRSRQAWRLPARRGGHSILPAQRGSPLSSVSEPPVARGTTSSNTIAAGPPTMIWGEMERLSRDCDHG
jgi:hypothetical protein